MPMESGMLVFCLPQQQKKNKKQKTPRASKKVSRLYNDFYLLTCYIILARFGEIMGWRVT
jgi:hypothetical protein